MRCQRNFSISTGEEKAFCICFDGTQLSVELKLSRIKIAGRFMAAENKDKLRQACCGEQQGAVVASTVGEVSLCLVCPQ